MYLLPFQYNQTPTRNAKTLRFSQTLVSSSEYITFVGTNILKTLWRLAVATKRFFWEIKCREILTDKSKLFLLKLQIPNFVKDMNPITGVVK